MTKYSKFNIIYHLQKWMDSVAGQTFLNYAYSWGASIVILGALFKLTHMPSANFWLFLGMGTEVFVFFISAFDRPFDKTAEGLTLTSQPVAQQQNTDKVLTPDIQNLEPLLKRLENLNRLPDGLNTAEIENTLTAIHEVYKQQLIKVSSQLTSIDRMDEQIKIQNSYMAELNSIYARMIAAVGGKTEK